MTRLSPSVGMKPLDILTIFARGTTLSSECSEVHHGCPRPVRKIQMRLLSIEFVERRLFIGRLCARRSSS